MAGIRLAAAAAVACGALAAVSCTGFPRGWNRAVKSEPADALSGAWAGEWRSDINGHRGGLRCVVTPLGAGRWEYRFRASWARILCAGYSLECEATPDAGGGWVVEGSKDLGRLFGGVFRHRALVRGESYSAGYSSTLDRGTMTMHRVRRDPSAAGSSDPDPSPSHTP